jgi:DNA-binding response OmpR family regulator
LTFASSLTQGKQQLERGNFALLLVDLSLPDGTGLDLVSAARSMDKFFNVPILILSGKAELSQKAAAFAFGADDYLTKPYDPRELKIRVDAKVKRFEQSRLSRELLPVGNLVLDRSGRTLHFANDTIDLTTLEYRIFDAMASRQDRAFNRELLIQTVWGSRTNITVRTVDTHIANLRRKIQQSNVSIQTVFGTGYKLTVTEAEAQRSALDSGTTPAAFLK